MNTQLLAIALISSASFVGLGFALDDQPRAAAADEVARGKYLVTVMGCNDCHTPAIMGPNGPEKDMSRMLSGHPAAEAMPPAPQLPAGPWVVTAAGSLTAWSGPWGTSFTANLTPDPKTGLGEWKLEEFIATMRTGRHLGRGREILPPMPYQQVAALTDEDLGAVFAYLQSVPAVDNLVPEPLPPSEQR